MTTHRPAVSGLFHLASVAAHAADIAEKRVILPVLRQDRHAELRHLMLAMGCNARAIHSAAGTGFIPEVEVSDARAA